MPRATRPTRAPVSVIGTGLAGIAAAVRLAKAGHPVTLHPIRSDPGDDPWQAARASLPGDVLTFPAPWRDLFTKSGRPMEAALAVAGLDLVTAPVAEHRFGDGSVLRLPTDRAGQHHAVAAFAGPVAADRWQALMDHLLEVWQAVRPLGLEGELVSRRQLTPQRRALLDPRRSLAELAADLGDHRLGSLVLATSEGSDPARTPSWRATGLVWVRTFGRWQLQQTDGDVAPVARIVDLLVQRLEQRRVVITEPISEAPDGPVVCTLHPRHPIARSLHTAPERLRLGRLPAIDPVDPDRGFQWRGPRTPWRLPRTTGGRPLTWFAGSWTPAGSRAAEQVLSGALAAYACHAVLVPDPDERDKAAVNPRSAGVVVR